MTMKTTELIKKLGKLLGKKETPAATHQLQPPEPPKPRLRLDTLGVIQLHPDWRN